MQTKRFLQTRKTNHITYMHPRNTLQLSAVNYHIYNVLDSLHYPIFKDFKSEVWADQTWDMLGDLQENYTLFCSKKKDLSLVSSLIPILIFLIHSQHLIMQNPKSLEIITTCYISAYCTNQHYIKSGYDIHIKMSMNNILNHHIQAVYYRFYFLSAEDDKKYLPLTMGYYMLLLLWLMC